METRAEAPGRPPGGSIRWWHFPLALLVLMPVAAAAIPYDWVDGAIVLSMFVGLSALLYVVAHWARDRGEPAGVVGVARGAARGTVAAVCFLLAFLVAFVAMFAILSGRIRTANPSLAAGAVGTRGNPVPLGQSLTSTDHGSIVEYRVVRVVRGAPAYELVITTPTAIKPPDGRSYVAVLMEARCVSGTHGRNSCDTPTNLALYAADRYYAAPGGRASPNPPLAAKVELGATLEGWLPARYLPDDLADRADLVYDGIYFALSPR